MYHHGTSPGKTNKYIQQNVNEKYERNININNLVNKLPSNEDSNNKLIMKTSAEVCQGCQKPIKDRYLLNSLGRNWHEDCLKCTCCEARLGEVGASLFTRANLILCKRDYLRLFGHTGQCSACNKVIPAFEMVMRAKHNVYHLECFACQLCGHRFCVGDRFYLCDNKILCESDYSERFIFGNSKSCYDNTAMSTDAPPVDMPPQYRPMPPTAPADCNNNGHGKRGTL